jgi:hypothetical protein
VARAGDEEAFAGRLPAGLGQQRVAQRVQAFAGAADRPAARASGRGRQPRQIGLVVDLQHRHARGQRAAMAASAAS